MIIGLLTVGLSATSFSLSVTNAVGLSGAKSAIDQVKETNEMLHQNDLKIKEILRDVENQVLRVADAVDNLTDETNSMKTGLPTYIKIVAFLYAELTRTADILDGANDAWNLGKLDPRLIRYLNITDKISCKSNGIECKIDLAEAQSCVWNQRDQLIDMEIKVPQVHKNYQVLKADPFRLYEIPNNSICMVQYTGPRHVLYHQQKRCVIPMHDYNMSPMEEFESVPIIDKCPEVQRLPASEYWDKVECRPFDMAILESLTQVKHYGNQVQIYCPGKSIEVYGHKHQCPDFPFALDSNVTFETGHMKYEYKSAEILVNNDHYDKRLSDLPTTLLLPQISGLNISHSIDLTRKKIDGIRGIPEKEMRINSTLIGYLAIALLTALVITTIVLGCKCFKSGNRRVRSEPSAPGETINLREHHYEVPTEIAPVPPERPPKHVRFSQGTL